MQHTTRLRTFFTRLTLLVILATNAGRAADEILETTDAPTGGDFQLMSADGPFRLSDLKGQVVVLFFGYSQCPDVCPISLATLSQALDRLDEQQLSRVTGVFISVDHKRDKPKELQLYAAYFHENFIGLTGTEEQINKAARLYGAKHYEVALDGSAFGYSVNHSASSYLITPDGELRFIFPHNTPSSVLTEAIQHLLAGN